MFQFILNNIRKCKPILHRDDAWSKKRLFHEDYRPFFSVGLTPSLNIPVDRFLTENLEVDEFDIKYGSASWISNPQILKAVKTMLEKGDYFSALMANYCQGTYPDFKSNLAKAVERFYLRSTDTTCYYPISLTHTAVGIEDVFDYMRMFNSYMCFRISRGNLKGKNYLTNMLFLAECATNGTNPKVLAIVMVKKEDVFAIRQRFINNEPIPSTMMELWVDNVLESEGDKLKPHFRKFIKNKFENIEVPIKYFDNLDKEVTRTLTCGSTSLQDRTGWAEELIKEYVDYRRLDYQHTVSERVPPMTYSKLNGY